MRHHLYKTTILILYKKSKVMFDIWKNHICLVLIIQYSISTNSWSDYLKIICHLFCTLITCNTGFSVLLPYFNKLEMFLIEGVTAMLPRVYSKRSFLKTRSDVRRKKKDGRCPESQWERTRDVWHICASVQLKNV